MASSPNPAWKRFHCLVPKSAWNMPNLGDSMIKKKRNLENASDNVFSHGSVFNAFLFLAII